MASRTHVGAVRRFVKAADWLGDQDAPAVTALLALARRLDTDEAPTPALFSQYGLTYRSLLKRKPSEDEHDPLAELLGDADE